mgnify:CR=1 FL=1
MEQKYKVKLIFKYSDTVYVSAENEKKAVEKALMDCDEQYESLYDAQVSLDKPKGITTKEQKIK